MLSNPSHKPLIFVAVLGALALSSSSWADVAPTVGYGSSPVGKNFEYDLLVSSGTYTIDGLIVVNGFTEFGITFGSTVTPPMNWTDFLPVPGVLDNLTYVPLMASANIPPGSMYDRKFEFSFISATSPACVTNCFGGISVTLIAIAANSNNTSFNLTAQPIPEPATMTVLGLVLCALIAIWPRRTS